MNPVCAESRLQNDHVDFPIHLRMNILHILIDASQRSEFQLWIRSIESKLFCLLGNNGDLMVISLRLQCYIKLLSFGGDKVCCAESTDLTAFCNTFAEAEKLSRLNLRGNGYQIPDT